MASVTTINWMKPCLSLSNGLISLTFKREAQERETIETIMKVIWVDLHRATSLRSTCGATSTTETNSCGLRLVVTRRKIRSLITYHFLARIANQTKTLSRFTRRRNMRFLVHKHTRQTPSGYIVEESASSFLQTESLKLKKSFKMQKGQRLLAPIITRRNTATRVKRSEYWAR